MYERIDRIEMQNRAKFNAEVAKFPREELDKEYERLMGGMDCDEAARIQSDKDFAATILQALENLKMRKNKVREVMAAYA